MTKTYGSGVVVENNSLNGDKARALDKEWRACQTSGGDCKAVADKYQALSDKNYAELQQICADSPLTCASYQKQLVDTGTPPYVPTGCRPGLVRR